MFAFVLQEGLFVGVQEERADVGVRVAVVVVFHVAEHLHHGEVLARLGAIEETAAGGDGEVETVQVEGFVRALQTAVERVLELLERDAARAVVRLERRRGGAQDGARQDLSLESGSAVTCNRA